MQTFSITKHCTKILFSNLFSRIELNNTRTGIPISPKTKYGKDSEAYWKTKSGMVNCSRGTYLKRSDNLST
jgi:hypothetical protein